MYSVAGFDIPTRLRRSVGRGKVIPVSVLEPQLRAIDGDRDGHLTKLELSGFFLDHGFGGSWLCQVLTATIWKAVDPALHEPKPTVEVPLLARVIHLLMARKPRPSKRYTIKPEMFRPQVPQEEQAATLVAAPVAERRVKPSAKPTAKPAGPRKRIGPRAAVRPTARPSRPSARPAPGRPRS